MKFLSPLGYYRRQTSSALIAISINYRAKIHILVKTRGPVMILEPKTFPDPLYSRIRKLKLAKRGFQTLRSSPYLWQTLYKRLPREYAYAHTYGSGQTTTRRDADKRSQLTIRTSCEK